MSVTRNQLSLIGEAFKNNLLSVIALVLLLAFRTENLGAAEAGSPQTFNPKNPRVQAELERLRKKPMEGNPRKRPLVVSEHTSNRKDWIEKVLSQGYSSSGHTNAQWDARVRAAFSAYANYSRASQWDQYKALVGMASAALAAGCDDPMIRYIDVRYRLADNGVGAEEFALAALRAHEAMLDSRYHPILKFFAGYRATEAARTADVGGNRGPLVNLTTEALEDLARDTNAPTDEVFDAAEMWVEHSHDKSWLDFILSDLQSLLERTWGREERWFRFCGAVEIRRAWAQRGGGFANTVTDQGWEGFRDHLEKAEQPLKTAWQMNSNVAQTAYLMMRLELGQGRERAIMETWFKRAMALETNYYDAAALMAFYLEPRWHGSEEETLKFGRACVASTHWGGRVPLVLLDTHYSLARYYKKVESAEYWQRPQVWKDVQSSYEKFFRLNPEETGWRHNYARDAYLCGHYAEFLQQTKLFAGNTNFAFFGGEQKLRDMLARASAAAVVKRERD